MTAKYFTGYPAEVDPATLHFTATEGATCEGCIFLHQRSNVCHKAAHVAALIALPDCSKGQERCAADAHRKRHVAGCSRRRAWPITSRGHIWLLLF